MSRTTKRRIAQVLIFTYHTLNFLAVAICVAFLVWVAASFIEIQIHNLYIGSDKEYIYSSLNFFGKMLEWFPCK